MDVNELYRAMVAEEAGNLRQDRLERQARRLPAMPIPPTADQNARIRLLERQNLALRKHIAEFARVLLERGVIDPRELQQISHTVNQSVQTQALH